MHRVFRVVAALAVVLGLSGVAWAEPVASLVFSGNTWGYFNPCPT